MTDIYEVIGKRLRAARKRRGHTLEELAHLARLTPSFLGQVERGERKVSLAALERLARALRLRLDRLLYPESKAETDEPLADRLLGLAGLLTQGQRRLLIKLLRVVARHERAS
jgi:transcriptional regulator with XRE-family HTH domain